MTLLVAGFRLPWVEPPPKPMTRPRPPDTDPQCPLILQRIHELQDDLSLEAEPTRADHWRRQMRTLTERARRLGCFATTHSLEPTRIQDHE
jgi:hypothetical protein